AVETAFSPWSSPPGRPEEERRILPEPRVPGFAISTPMPLRGSQGFQVLDQVELFLVGKTETKPGVITVHDIKQSLEAAIVVKPAFVLWVHEQTSFANEEA